MMQINSLQASKWVSTQVGLRSTFDCIVLILSGAHTTLPFEEAFIHRYRGWHRKTEMSKGKDEAVKETKREKRKGKDRMQREEGWL